MSTLLSKSLSSASEQLEAVICLCAGMNKGLFQLKLFKMLFPFSHPPEGL